MSGYNPYYPTNYYTGLNPNYQMSNNQQQNQQIIWVNGREEVDRFFVAANNVVALWDRNSPTIYLKSADVTGRTNLEVYDLIKRNPEVTSKAESSTPTREEFDSLKSKVDTLLKELKGEGSE